MPTGWALVSCQPDVSEVTYQPTGWALVPCHSDVSAVSYVQPTQEASVSYQPWALVACEPDASGQSAGLGCIYTRPGVSYHQPEAEVAYHQPAQHNGGDETRISGMGGGDAIETPSGTELHTEGVPCLSGL